MGTIFAEYNPKRNSIDVYTSVGYMLRIDCWEAEKNLTTTPGSDCALNALATDEPCIMKYLLRKLILHEIAIMYKSEICIQFNPNIRCRNLYHSAPIFSSLIYNTR